MILAKMRMPARSPPRFAGAAAMAQSHPKRVKPAAAREM